MENIYTLERIAALEREVQEQRSRIGSLDIQLGRLEHDLRVAQALQQRLIEVLQHGGLAFDPSAERAQLERRLQAQAAQRAQQRAAPDVPFEDRLRGFKMTPLPDEE